MANSGARVFGAVPLAHEERWKESPGRLEEDISG